MCMVSLSYLMFFITLQSIKKNKNLVKTWTVGVALGTLAKKKKIKKNQSLC